MKALGLRASRVAPEIELVAHDDWRARSPVGAIERAIRVFVARAPHEQRDLRLAIATERPDILLVDFNCWGAAAEAERSGLRWALFMPYFLPWRLPGLPPFGPGLRHGATRSAGCGTPPSARSSTRSSIGTCRAFSAQKALAAGVPVCVVPFGRDQLEVARHVDVAGAGTRLLSKDLTPSRLRAAIGRARELREGAERVAAGFRAAGGPAAAVAALESSLPLVSAG